MRQGLRVEITEEVRDDVLKKHELQEVSVIFVNHEKGLNIPKGILNT